MRIQVEKRLIMLGSAFFSRKLICTYFPRIFRIFAFLTLEFINSSFQMHVTNDTVLLSQKDSSPKFWIFFAKNVYNTYNTEHLCNISYGKKNPNSSKSSSSWYFEKDISPIYWGNPNSVKLGKIALSLLFFYGHFFVGNPFLLEISFSFIFFTLRTGFSWHVTFFFSFFIFGSFSWKFC